ncbi:MAG: hypothetical protein JSS27_19010 [Planctomycetes bacterium]|nr:hypothetical protein [Planctomycetota bacterium]
MSSGDKQCERDAEHLNMLAIAHYVVGGLGFLCASFPLIHVTVFGAMAIHPEWLDKGKANAEAPPTFFFGAFAIMAALMVLLGYIASGLTIYSGRQIKQRRRRMFSIVMAGVMLIFQPLGTILGVFTLVVLLRDSVKQLYEEAAAKDDPFAVTKPPR